MNKDIIVKCMHCGSTDDTKDIHFFGYLCKACRNGKDNYSDLDKKLFYGPKWWNSDSFFVWSIMSILLFVFSIPIIYCYILEKIEGMKKYD